MKTFFTFTHAQLTLWAKHAATEMHCSIVKVLHGKRYKRFDVCFKADVLNSDDLRTDCWSNLDQM